MFKRDYTYDSVGNVATMTNEVPTPDKVNTYTYDHRDRLTNWLETQSSTTLTNETYQYDAVGNITSKAGTSYSYGSYAHGAGGGGPYAIRNSGFSYDDNGNMTIILPYIRTRG
jgi:hypothetical protein